MVKLTVGASKSYKIQVRQFEPDEINSFISVEVDIADENFEEKYKELAEKIGNMVEADLSRKAVGLTKKHDHIASLAKGV